MAREFPRSLYAVWTNPLPGREDALHAWMENVHIPDSLAHRLFHSVRRYQAVGDSRARLLTLWGCEYQDEERALGAVRPVAEKLRAAGRVELVQEVVFQQFVFRQAVLSERGAERAAPLLTTLLSCWARADAASAFDAWRVNSPEFRAVVGAGGVAACYGVGPARAKSLALIEHVHASDVSAIAAACESALPSFGAPTPIFVDGSPAPSPAVAPPPSDAQLAARKPAWATHWRLLSARE